MNIKNIESGVWHFHRSVHDGFGFWAIDPNEVREFHSFESDDDLLGRLNALGELDSAYRIPGSSILQINRSGGYGKSFIPGESLPSGQYIYKEAIWRIPERLIPSSLRDDHFCHNTSRAHVLEDDLKTFLRGEKIYNELGFLWKRGYLLHGPPGNGKTSLIRNVLKNCLPDNSIAIWLGTKVPSEEFVRALETSAGKDRLVVFIVEELVSVLKERKAEAFLEFLDGEGSCSRSLFFATTNEIENLPDNMTKRPSRFDLVLEFGHPDPKDRNEILKLFLGQHPSEKIIAATEGFSIAYLKEAVLLHRLKSLDLFEAVSEVAQTRKLADSGFLTRRSIGLSIATPKSVSIEKNETDKEMK